MKRPAQISKNYDKWLTATQAAKLAGVTYQSIWSWGMQGKILTAASKRKQGKFVYSQRSIEEFLTPQY